MSGISIELGGSKATLWSYFSSKESLFAAVVNRLTLNYQSEIIQILQDDCDLEKSLSDFCAHFIQKATGREGFELLRLVIWENRCFPEIGLIFHERGPHVTQEELTKFLKRAMERGLLRLDNAALAARHLVALCLAGSRQQLIMGLMTNVTAADISRDVNEAMTTFIRAYTVSKTS